MEPSPWNQAFAAKQARRTLLSRCQELDCGSVKRALSYSGCRGGIDAGKVNTGSGDDDVKILISLEEALCDKADRLSDITASTGVNRICIAGVKRCIDLEHATISGIHPNRSISNLAGSARSASRLRQIAQQTRSMRPLLPAGMTRPSNKSSPSRPSSTTSSPSPLNSPSKSQFQNEVPLPRFLLQSKADQHNIFIDLEWAQRERLAAGLPSTAQPPSPDSTPPASPSPWSRLTGDEILARNRYMNVEPFAARRIKLRVADGANDYINASPIVLGRKRYIATQGPKDTSTAHFYRMLAAETGDTAVVVMLTQTREAGKEKCFQYFPLSRQSGPIDLEPDPETGDQFQGSVELISIEDDVKSRSTIRRLRMRTRMATGTSEQEEWTEKEVYHLLFGGWPDFLIPEGEDREALVHLIKLSERLNSKSSPPSSTSFDPYLEEESTDTNPRIIHCSAGVGRSGTFIALDYLLAQLEAGELDHVPPDSDPIAQTVDVLRQQRMMMVQGEGQFMFLYEALREAWVDRWKGRRRRD